MNQTADGEARPMNEAPADTTIRTGNPILPGIGLCDPHVRIFDGRAWLYATHDRSAENQHFRMDDWWIWSSGNLRDWRHECTLRPEQTYWGRPCESCWAVDAMARDGRYFLYFSRGPREIGVVTAPAPGGPWRDPLGKPLIAEGDYPTQARDPGLLMDDDGEAYLVFGTWDFFVARLNEDMISLAEPARPVELDHREGPYGPGKTDDKPCLHKRDGRYYLSWGCFYAVSESVYGPYRYRGSIITEENTDPVFRKGLLMDRHGSFFDFRGRSYFIGNDQSFPGSHMHFRNSVIAEVRYLPGGDIAPLALTVEGAPVSAA